MRIRTNIPLRHQLRAIAENIITGLNTSLVTLTLLVQQAILMTDAIVSTLVRIYITKRKLLKWVTALQVKTEAGHTMKDLIRPLGSVIVVLFFAGLIVLIFNPASLGVAAPFLLLWLLSPIAAHILSLPPKPDPAESLIPEDALQLRQVARRTWRFFTTFVTEQENYLPPDNFQEDPNPEIAHRSSPTNFGLYLISTLAAHDMGWIGLIDTVDRLEATLNTLNKDVETAWTFL